MLKPVLVALTIFMSGCAVFEGGKVAKTTLPAYEGATESKPTLSYVSLARGGMSTAQDLPENVQKTIETELVSVLQSSEYFSKVTKADSSADISIDIVLTNSGNPAAMVPALITGLSLYTIPSWATDNFNLVAKAERKDGLKKEYVLADSTTLVQWLPMIFAFPAKNFSVVPEVRKNMYRKVLADMKADGFFTNI